MAGKFSSNCTSTTAPITATILPEVPFPALAAGAVAYSDFDLSKEFKNRNQNLKLKIFNFAYIYIYLIFYLNSNFVARGKGRKTNPVILVYRLLYIFHHHQLDRRQNQRKVSL